MRMPGSTANGLAQVGVVQRHAQLAAIAAVDQPGAVHHRDAVVAGETRARQHEARTALGELARRSRAHAARSPGAISTSSTLTRSKPGVALVGPRGRSRRRVQETTGKLEHAPAASRTGSGTSRNEA